MGLNTSELERDFGFKPSTSIEEGGNLLSGIRRIRGFGRGSLIWRGKCGLVRGMLFRGIPLQKAYAEDDEQVEA